MLIRHGEKPVDPPPYGVTDEGEQSMHSLLVRGWQRAGALVSFFAVPTHPAIATPDVVYAANPTNNAAGDLDDAKSIRSQETVTPLVARLSCPFYHEISVGDESALIAQLREESGAVLVAWEHKHIPSIASGFIDDAPSWGDAFDVVWVLDRKTDDSYALTIVNQNLLAGDSGP